MDIITKVKEVLERETYIDERSGDMYGYEIFVDYRDEFGDKTLARISRSENPTTAFDESIEDWVSNAEDYYFPELTKTLRENIEEYDEYSDEIEDWVRDNVYWYLPNSVREQEVNVVISLDVGDGNYDFTECNILNYYGNGVIPKDSPIRWLAKQQRKLTELNKAIRGVRQSDDFYNKETQYSKFTRSVVQELQNACSHMNTLVFLVKMTINDFVELRYMMDSEKELNKSYYYDERKGTKEIIITKNATCGLYDIWGGGGSVLEIELEKDVKLPIKAIFDAWIDCRGCRANGRGWDVYDVYGLCESAYSGEVKWR